MSALNIARLGTSLTVLGSLYLLLVPRPPGAGTVPDWVAHACLLAVLGAWAGLSSGIVDRGQPRASTSLTLAAVLAFGPLTEVLQAFTGRDAALLDAAVDVLGSGAGFILGYAAWHWWERRTAR